MDSTVRNPAKGRPHPQLWDSCWRAIQSLRPAFSRGVTFIWFATVVVGLMFYPETGSQGNPSWPTHQLHRSCYGADQESLLQASNIVLANGICSGSVRREILTCHGTDLTISVPFDYLTWPSLGQIPFS